MIEQEIPLLCFSEAIVIFYVSVGLYIAGISNDYSRRTMLSNGTYSASIGTLILVYQPQATLITCCQTMQSNIPLSLFLERERAQGWGSNGCSQL